MSNEPVQPKPRRGRPPVRPDGRPLTAAERQARRRARLVDPRPARALLVDLAEVDERLAELRRAETPDVDAIWHADLLRAQISGDLAAALGVGVMWPVRELRRRQRAARGLDW